MRNPFGPLAWWEIRRLGRSRWLRRLRIGVVLTLLAVQFLFFLNYFAPNSWAALLGQLPLTLDELSRFGLEYHNLFVGAEAALLFLIVPILFIEPVSSANDRQMLDLLRCSPLTNFELMCGLVLPRYVIVAGLIMTGWPILALSTLYGGVGWNDILIGQLALVSSMLLWGTIGTSAGLRRVGGLASYGRAYAIAACILPIVFCVGCCVGSYGSLLVLLACILIILYDTLRNIRPHIISSMPDKPLGKASTTVIIHSQADLMMAPSLGHRDPWMWKEQYFPHRRGHLFMFDLMVQIGLWSSAFFEATALVTMFAWSTSDEPTLFVYAAFLVFGLYFVAVASIRTSLSVVREREQRTLETLLCLPVEPATILAAKWKGALYGYRFSLVVFAGMFVFACVLEWQRSHWMLGHGLQFVSWFILMTTLALWLSVRCRSSASAMIQLILWVIASLAVPPLLAPLFGEYAAVVNGMSFSAGWSAVFDQGDILLNLAGAGIDIGLSLLGAWALWWDACRRFRPSFSLDEPDA